MKGFTYLLLSALLGVSLLLQTGCVWYDSGYYHRSPYYYDSYYWYPYSGYYRWPDYYDRYYWYPYGSHYWWPYRSYRYRYWYDDDQRMDRPPQSPPPGRKPYRLEPNRPKGGRQPLDRPFLRKDRQE